MKQYFCMQHPNLKLTLLVSGKLQSVQFQNTMFTTDDLEVQEQVEAHPSFTPLITVRDTPEPKPEAPTPKRKQRLTDLTDVREALEGVAVEEFMKG